MPHNDGNGTSVQGRVRRSSKSHCRVRTRVKRVQRRVPGGATCERLPGTAREERSESHVQRRASLHIPHVRCGTISTKSQRSADFLMRWLCVSAMESALICVICGQSGPAPF